ncbi:MAG TPA: beta-propeller fold lactonase family protein [Alphaproteobacteria bacterium]|nr:beta-propeller fold lactonase family protein [Alphaproteobacteria bacterium]
MKNFVSAWSAPGLALLLILSLAGCGGVSANPRPTPTPTPMPTPPGATPTPTPTAAHGTLVYVSNTTSITGFRLNPDGTLSQLAGSPFAVQGFISAAGSFLLVFSGTSVSTYQVDPASGVPSFVSSVSVPGASGGTADAQNLYVQGNIPNSNLIGFYGFAISANGMLTPVAGSPFAFGQACDFCDVPESMALNDNFLIVGGVGFHGVGDFTVYARGPGGVLGAAQILGTNAQESVTIQHPGPFAYGLDTSDFSVQEYTISASGKATPGAQLFLDNPQQVVVHTSNKFLLIPDLPGVVHVFSIDPATGAFSQIGTSEAAGNGTGGLAMDPSGRFVFVVQGANPNFPGSTNQITIYSFDPGSGAMKKLQSYPQSPSAEGMVVIAR